MRFTIYLLLLSTIYSCVSKRQSPPDAIVVEAPTSVSSTVKPGEWLLLFRLTKADGLWYKYDTTTADVGLKKIEPLTTENIKVTLDGVEKTFNIRMDTMKNILLKGDITSAYEEFKELKEALKQKKIYKFRLIVNNDN